MPLGTSASAIKGEREGTHTASSYGDGSMTDQGSAIPLSPRMQATCLGNTARILLRLACMGCIWETVGDFFCASHASSVFGKHRKNSSAPRMHGVYLGNSGRSLLRLACKQRVWETSKRMFLRLACKQVSLGNRESDDGSLLDPGLWIEKRGGG